MEDSLQEPQEGTGTEPKKQKTYKREVATVLLSSLGVQTVCTLKYGQ